MIFLFYDLPACNKKDKILSLPTALIAYFSSEFNHVFALLISMLRSKALIFIKIGLKLS